MSAIFNNEAKLREFCRADRDALLGSICKRRGLDPKDVVPAQLVYAILEEDLKVPVVPKYLPGHVLGRMDFVERRLGVNVRLKDLSLPNTNVDGHRNFIVAHELGHLRCGHETELRRRMDVHTRALFEVSAPSLQVCSRQREAAVTPEEKRRERQASIYGSTFLVPEYLLVKQKDARAVEFLHRRQHEVDSEALWPLVLNLAKFFHVTGDLMAWRLVEMGWLTRKERVLAVRQEGWLPFRDEEQEEAV